MEDQLEALKRWLPDIQAGQPRHPIPLKQVGVVNLRYPVLVDINGARMQVLAEIEAAVDLPADQRGAHMSRFAEEIIQAFALPIAGTLFEELAERLAHELMDAHPYARNAVVTIKADMHLDGHPYKLVARYNLETAKRSIGVEVQGALACPCAIAMTGGLSHNQRGTLVIELETGDQFVPAETLVQLAEQAFSTPVRLLLKRPQEKAIVEAMHKNPKFVEDVVRDCVVLLKERFAGLKAFVRCTSYESIHPYDVYAAWEGTL